MNDELNSKEKLENTKNQLSLGEVRFLYTSEEIVSDNLPEGLVKIVQRKVFFMEFFKIIKSLNLGIKMVFG